MWSWYFLVNRVNSGNILNSWYFSWSSCNWLISCGSCIEVHGFCWWNITIVSIGIGANIYIWGSISVIVCCNITCEDWISHNICCSCVSWISLSISIVVGWNCGSGVSIIYCLRSDTNINKDLLGWSVTVVCGSKCISWSSIGVSWSSVGVSWSSEGDFWCCHWIMICSIDDI